MTKEDAIKYLQQLYPNGGHCWLDEQRIEAINMAVKSLQEEPVSEELEDITQKITYEGEVYTRCYKDKLDEFACKYPISVPKPPKRYAKYSDTDLTIAVKAGAKWQREQMQSSIVELAKNTQYREDLETKEVDFINEFHTFSEKHKLMDKDIEFSDIEKTASFFFQLGLKAKEEKRKYIGLVGGTFTTTTK